MLLVDPRRSLAGLRDAMTRWPRWLVVGLIAEALTSIGLGVLVLDMAIHRRTALREGINRWGYRGSIVRQRQPRENRLVIVGGSAAFGYGNPLDETFAAYLERNLQQTWRAGARGIPVTVMNLAAVPDDAASFAQTLRDYEWLDYDIVCFYDGYNSLTAMLDADGWRRESAIYRRTHYLPVLPQYVTGQPMVGRPRVAIDSDAASGSSANCASTWSRYCESMAAAVSFVLARGSTAIVVTPPVVSARHAGQQRAMADDLIARFGGNNRFAYLNFASLVDLRDRSLSYDGVHLTAKGNDAVADALTGPVLRVLR